MVKRIRFLVAVLLLGALVACSGGSNDKDSSGSGTGTSADSSTSSGTGGSSGASASSDSGGDSGSASSGAATVTAHLESFEDCHEKADAGGNSDGVVVVSFTGVAEGTGATLKTNKGESTAAVKDGKATFLVRLDNIGETVTIESVTVLSQTVSAADMNAKPHTVADSSNCTHHP